MTRTMQTMQFGEFAEVQPKVRLDKGSPYSFIEMADVEPRVKSVRPRGTRIWNGSGGSKFEDGDTIFARITPCLEHGKTARVLGLSESRGFGSTEFFVFRARRGVSHPDYVYYLSMSPLLREPAIKSMIGSSGRQRAQKVVVENTLVPTPTLPEQERIASILSAYDDLIENNRRRIQLLEQAARLLYKEWFVRFRFPGHEHVKVIEGVPAKWERVATPIAIDINPHTKLSDDREHWWVEMGDLPLDSMVIQSARRREGRGGSKFQNGDILFARITPCLENGKTAFVDFLSNGETARGSTEFIVLRSKRLSPEYVYCLSRTYAFRHNAIKSMIGSSGRQRVQESCFDKFMVLIPPLAILGAFTDIVRPIFRQIRTLHVQSQEAGKARDLLLPRLMSGEVAV